MASAEGFTSTLQRYSALLQLIVDAVNRAKESHARFNVFTALLPAHDEVRLHTRFLHCLLDPAGMHDFKSLFLKLFFDTLNDIPGTNHEGNSAVLAMPPEAVSWSLEKEAWREGYGQMDLLLLSPGCGIVIENKIYAVEQPNQLSSYARYLAAHHVRYSQVLYLTLDGKQSETHDGIPYIRVSYNKHILNWIERCLEAVNDAPLIHQVLLQYRSVVQELTGNSITIKAMKPITDFIRANPDIIAYRKQIDAAIVQVRADFLDQLAAAIKANLEPEFHVRLRDNLQQGRFGTDPNGALIIKPPVSSPLARFEIWVEHISKWQDALIVGIQYLYGGQQLSNEDQHLMDKMNSYLEQYSAATGYQKVPPRATWAKTWWPTGSHDLIYPFDDEKLASLLSSNLQHTFGKLTEEIRSHIRLLETAYNVSTGA